MQSIQVEEQSMEIFCGSLRGLLRALASKEDSEDYHTTFLMTYDYFITPVNLLRTIILFYRASLVSLTVQDVPEDVRAEVYQARLIDFINLWVTLRFDVLQRHSTWYNTFTSFITYLKTAMPGHSSALTQTWQALESQWNFYRERQGALMIKTPSSAGSTVQFLYISAQQMAEQLTLREQSYFQIVEIHEYYGKAWDDGDARSPHLSKIITRFADMSYWVATTILEAQDMDGAPSDKCRAQTISRFIHTMNELYNLNNFNTLMQIWTALNMSVVERLRGAWALVDESDRAIMDKIGALMHHSNNYERYREALDLVEDDPCIPFHSLLLRDLLYIEEDETHFEEGIVNFEKMTLLSQLFERLQDFRLQLYDIEEDPSVQLFLHNKVVRSQKELEQLSLMFSDGEEDDEEAFGDPHNPVRFKVVPV